MKRFILIDAHAIIHRAYHALPPLSSPAGDATNAAYGFTAILLRMLRELKPDYIAAAFDLPGPTFRHVAYERYKAQRPETPSDLSSQFAIVRKILDSFGISRFEKKGFEADDIIGTIAQKMKKKKDTEVIIVTGDMDALQLVRPGLKVYSMRKGMSDIVSYDKKAVEERYGLPPEKLLDFKGLKGDPSDNIPGVKGIGEKTAADLIRTFGSIEKLYGAIKKKDKRISPSLKEKLERGAEDAKFSRELSRIKTDVVFPFALEKLRWQDGAEKPEVNKLFLTLGFFSLLKRLGEEPQKSPVQITLLGQSSASALKVREFRNARELETFFSEHRTDAVACTVENGKLFILPEDGKNVCVIEISAIVQDRATDTFKGVREIFAHDGKAFLHALGKKAPLPVFDSMIAAYLVEPFNRDFSYRAVLSRQLGRLTSPRLEEEWTHFFEVKKCLEEKLKEGKLADVFKNIEMPLVPILAAMEERGILVDTAFLADIAEKIDTKLETLTKDIYEISGEQFNINSSQQLSKILFEKLEIKTHGLRKTEKGGVISTGAAELEKLKGSHPIIENILAYRELTKLKTTYVDALPRLVNSQTGRIHTTFNQTGTSTGRLSSLNPNLQNIPIMSDYGKEIRKAFVVEKGFLLVSFDYSQIELRVAAHMAIDKKMIQAFGSGADIHRITASEIYNVAPDKVTPELRRAAKTLNFGVLYGMGASAFAESTGMPREDAKKFIDEYFRDFAGIKKYIEDTKQFAYDHGYVETLFGRRRYIPEIYSPNWSLKREAERMAVNMPIQGSATGDIVKLAMIKVDEWMRKEKLGDSCRMLLQVHDELLFEIQEDIMKKVVPYIKKIMESVTELKVPLVVDAHSGKNWGEK